MMATRGALRGLVLLGLLSAGWGLAQTVLTVDEAATRIGETVTFEGKVMSMASSPEFKATYASFGGAYPFQKLSVLFAGENEAIVSCDLPRLNGRTVRVTGKVEGGKRGPVVRVTDTNQIEVLAVAVMDSLDSEGEGSAFRKQLKATLRDRFKAGDYASLDAVAAKWRTGKERLLDGTWKIAIFYGTFSEPVLPYPDYFRALEEWQAAFPDSITPRLLQANARVAHAWEARGDGPAITVTEEGWKAFRERLALARTELAALHARRTECPQWFAVMQVVALGQGWSRPEYEALFEEAIRYEPEYLVYYDRKINYLQPKWHGEEGEWVEFVNSLLDRFPGGLGEELYARLAFVYRKDSDQEMLRKKGRYFPDMGFRWEPMKAGFERMRARFPKSSWILNGYAIFAGKAGDWETTRRLLLELGDNCDMNIWLTWNNVALARMWADGKGLSDSYFILFR